LSSFGASKQRKYAAPLSRKIISIFWGLKSITQFKNLSWGDKLIPTFGMWGYSNLEASHDPGERKAGNLKVFPASRPLGTRAILGFHVLAPKAHCSSAVLTTQRPVQ
jgi:hypothetical protein